MDKVTLFLYKWLPIICGCHCLDARSFHFRGRKFPVCARCTGELCGIVIGIVCCFFFRLPIVSSLLMMVWMVIDGTVQLLTPYESKNIIRALSGFLFGFGLFMLFADTTVLVFNFGVNLVK